MDAKAAQRLQFSTLIHHEKIARKPSDYVKFSRGFREPQRLQAFVFKSATAGPSCSRRRAGRLEIACSYNNLPGSYINNSILSITIRILFPVFLSLFVPTSKRIYILCKMPSY